MPETQTAKFKSLEFAKEITVAAVSNAANIYPNADSGKDAADFFDEIFKKINETAEKNNL